MENVYIHGGLSKDYGERFDNMVFMEDIQYEDR